MTWWLNFFDTTYLSIWGDLAVTPARTTAEVEGIWSILQIKPGGRVLDAPCGFGRISGALAARGASVLGVDYSVAMLARARQAGSRAEYLQHDLRMTLPVRDFDFALNLFSSIGYGTRNDDLKILGNIRDALKPDGQLLLETTHRDMVAAGLATGPTRAMKTERGTWVVEDSSFNPRRAHLVRTWHYWGSEGTGVKTAEMVVYTLGEIETLLNEAGFAVADVHAGLTTRRFDGSGTKMGGRAAFVCRLR